MRKSGGGRDVVLSNPFVKSHSIVNRDFACGGIWIVWFWNAKPCRSAVTASGAIGAIVRSIFGATAPSLVLSR
jgi:hypothetical protein